MNFDFYNKVLSTNYKPVFTALKKLIYLLRYCNFCKKFPIQKYGVHFFFEVIFLGNLKNQ